MPQPSCMRINQDLSISLSTLKTSFRKARLPRWLLLRAADRCAYEIVCGSTAYSVGTRLEKKEIYILVVLALLCAPSATLYAPRRPACPLGDALSLHWRRPARKADTGTRPICNSCKAAMFQHARATDIIWSLSKFKKANTADLLE